MFAHEVGARNYPDLPKALNETIGSLSHAGTVGLMEGSCLRYGLLEVLGTDLDATGLLSCREAPNVEKQPSETTQSSGG